MKGIKFLLHPVVLFLLACPFSAAALTEGLQTGRFLRYRTGNDVVHGFMPPSSQRVFPCPAFPPFPDTIVAEKGLSLDDVEILPPSVPTKVFGVASNYRSVEDESKPKPPFPQVFFKSPSAVIPHLGKIVIPKDCPRVLYEGEMVVVIGKQAKDVSVDDASEYIFGITCGNDVSGGSWGEDSQWWRSKGADTFAPCGPWIVTGLDYGNLSVELRVNGEVKQRGNTLQMVHSVDETVSFVSGYLTLEPGDLIYTGTPGPIGELKPGDVVEVEVEGVGVLQNTVVSEN